MYTITYSACQSVSGNQPWDAVLAKNPVAHVFSGDFVYNDGAGQDLLGQNYIDACFWDYVLDPVGAPANAHNATTAYNRWHYRYGTAGRRSYRDFWNQVTARGIKVYFQADDHDCAHNNFDHTVAQSAATWLNGVNGQTRTITTQSQVLQIWRFRIQALRNIIADYGDNPPFGPPNGDIPSAMVGTASASEYPVEYFYQDFGDTGFGGKTLRLIFPDSVSYKNPQTDPDTAAKQFWGPTQEEWLYRTALEAKQQGFGMVGFISTKDLFNVDNNDGPWTYSVRRDALLQKLSDAGIPSFWLTGDKHVPHAGVTLTAAGQAYNSISICACPFGQGCGQLAQYAQNNWYASRNDQAVFGAIEVDSVGQTVTVSIVDAFTGQNEYSVVLPFFSQVPSSVYMAPNEPFVGQGGHLRRTGTWGATNTTYQNTSAINERVVVSGGTVSAIAVSRDNTTFDATGLTAGQFYLAPGDWLRVTHTGAPSYFVYPD